MADERGGMADIDKLLLDYGNAEFDCGAFEGLPDEYAPLQEKAAELRDELRAAYEELTNPGFKAFIAMAERFLEHYPPSVFTGVSGDVGPFFVVGLRELLKEYDKMNERRRREDR